MFSDTSIESVKKYLEEFSFIKYYTGYFPDTITEEVKENTFSFIHMDADIYQSALDSCEFFYPLLAQGGVMVFDDYGLSYCAGCKMAIDKYFQDKPDKPFYLPTGQAILIKKY